jgi:tetratricopeptide (TPR) repeat protein
MKSRWLLGVLAAVLLLGAGVAAALFLTQRRDVTTSSAEAYEAYKEAVANEGRFYFKEARVGYAKALELDPQFAMAMLGLARQAKDDDQRETLIRRAAREAGRLSERERLHVEMQMAFAERRVDDGRRIATELHQKYPADVRSATTLAHFELAKGNNDKAIRIFEELLAVDPNNAEAYNQVGYYYGYRGEYEKAMEYLQKYKFIAQDNANPFDSLGEVQAYSGRYNEAIENFNHALAIKPDFVASIGHLAVVYEGLGEYAKAADQYLKAAEMSDTTRMQREFLMRSMRTNFYAKDAERLARTHARVMALPKEKYSEVTNEYCDIALDLAQRRPAQAERRLRALLPKLDEIIRIERPPAEYKPHFPEWHTLMALALEEQGKTDEAFAEWQKNANPPNPFKDFEDRRSIYEARARVAEILARRGELDKAEKLIAENRKWNPNWAPTRESEVAVAELRRAKVLAASK